MFFFFFNAGKPIKKLMLFDRDSIAPVRLKFLESRSLDKSIIEIADLPS